MISPQTDLKLKKGLSRLVEDQRGGIAPPPGEVSRADIARRAGVSEITIANIERMFAARLAAALLNDPSTPTNLIRQSRLIISKL